MLLDRQPRTTTAHRLALVLALTGLLAACGGGGDRSARPRNTESTAGAGTAVSSDTSSAGTALPEECTPAPYTVVAQRDGGQPAGSSAFEVAGSAGLPIPLVPDKEQVLTPAQVNEQGATTSLLGYIVFFGDEPFGPGDVSTFGGYEPEAAGKSRGNIGLFPNSNTPLAIGDVLTPGTLEPLGMLTTFNRINMDFKAAPDELTGYLDGIKGSVTILALDNEFICIDVDLSWEYSDFSSSAQGVLTVQGIFTAPLGARSLPFT